MVSAKFNRMQTINPDVDGETHTCSSIPTNLNVTHTLSTLSVAPICGSIVTSNVLRRPPQCLREMCIVMPSNSRFLIDPASYYYIRWFQLAPTSGSIIASEIFSIGSVI